MKKFFKVSYFLIILFGSAGLLAPEDLGIDIPKIEENIKVEEQKQEQDLEAEKQIVEEEQKQLAAIKNESAESQAADTAAITKEADEQLAPYRSDSAFETASIKTETNKIESEEEVAGNVSKNLAAEKAFVTDTDQQEANQTLLNVQTNVEWFGKQIESSRSFSPKQKFSLMDTFNGLKEDLAVIDLSNNSDLTTDQIKQTKELIVHVDAMRNVIHARIVNSIDAAIDTANSAIDGIEKAVADIQETITLVYGLSTKLSANATDLEKEFNAEGKRLLNLIDGVKNSADYDQKLMNLKQNIYDISIDLLDECLESEEQLKDDSSEEPYLSSLDDVLNGGIHILDDLMNKYEPELAAQNDGALKVKVSTILHQAEAIITRSNYDTLTVSQLSDTGQSVDYALYSLKEALKITTDENHLAQINKDISDLMLAKLKIDAALPIAQVAKGVHSFNSEFNKNATGQVTAVKSLGQRFFGKIIDVMNSLFENIKGLVVDKTIGVFKDQNSALKTNLDTITTHVQQYVADSTVMINSVNSLIADAIPDFSHDTTPVARITDPNYKKLEEKLKTAESQLQLLEKQVIDAYAKQQKSIVLVNDIGGKQALFTVSVELGKLAYFVKKDGAFDGQKMNDYFSQNIKGLVGDDATLSALGYAKSGVGNAQENLALGKELFEGIQNKKFGDLTYDQAFSLAAFYRIKLLNASKGYVTVEANSVRDFTNLLDQGGDGMWQQIKVCMQGGIDVGTAIQKEDPTFADALAYYKNTIWFSAASINADLLQNYGNVCRTRDQLKEWIAKANEALYGTVPDFPNDTTVLVVDSKTHTDLTTDQFSEHDPIIGQDPFIPEDTSF